MSEQYKFCEHINLHVPHRISAEDAKRQEKTSREILKRFSHQPGVILADEVGMGKTFCALAVAASVALSTHPRRPVVIMEPPSLKEKWPADFELFREKCLPREIAEKLNYGRAERAVEFLKFLDDPPERMKPILFVTHGAMSRGLMDKWVKLALIYQALRNRKRIGYLRNALYHFMGPLLQTRWVERHGIGIWEDLLSSHPSGWLNVLHKWHVDPEGDEDPLTDDDPVPKAVLEVMSKLDTDPIYQSLKSIPLKKSKYLPRRLQTARQQINESLRFIWDKCIRMLNLKLPLLILDEAHHLKNPETRLASLFQVPEAQEDVEEITRGPLGGVFERMLFLTATPFQLGHGELCSVLDRFSGISWTSKTAPKSGIHGFNSQIKVLHSTLDSAQEAAITLDNAWGMLTREDLTVGETLYEDVETWWKDVQTASDITANTEQVIRCYSRTRARMKEAERLLCPWVIRHLKPRFLPEPYHMVERRRRLPGAAISQKLDEGDGGLQVSGEALLPFLLAARATSHAPESRPVFAEGLASSYEAFLHTRQMHIRADKEFPEEATDIDDEAPEPCQIIDSARWYLDKLEVLVPKGDPQASASHPKVSTTVGRVLDIWRAGEKVIVFCHYIATGRALRQRIAEAIDDQIKLLGAKRLGCKRSEVPRELERIGRRFFDEESPIRRACDEEMAKILHEFGDLQEYHDRLIEISRRNIRTPSFLVRFFPLQQGRLTADAMMEALDKRDRSGLSLRNLLHHFFEFLLVRCGEEDRKRYIDAVNSIQTGRHFGSDITRSFADDELQGDSPERLIPNVRLVNGTTKSETRQRLMLTFNTPFYPEVLIASSVMAEGVDLQVNCRYVIHHDLCWNPSTLEQRTGRIDRIGAKVEYCGQPIHIYLPYISETQDEKMYRVVMDRERWFKVVMGEKYKVDAKTAEKMAERIPLPEAAARELAFRLEVI